MNDSLFVPLMGFVMTIVTSWMLGLHADTVSIYHSVYTTYVFLTICISSLMAVTETPYKSNMFKMLCYQSTIPLLGWLVASIVKFGSRESPVWDINDLDFLDLLCFCICILWEIFLAFKGMPTYYELFYFGVFEKQSGMTEKIERAHVAVSYAIAAICFIEILVLSAFQLNMENIVHIVFNFFPIVVLAICAGKYYSVQKQRSDAKIFTASNYSFMWITIFFQLSFLVQALAYAVKFGSYNTCSDCYLGIVYLLNVVPLLYLTLYGFQKFTIIHTWLPNYFFEEQVLFFTTAGQNPSTATQGPSNIISEPHAAPSVIVAPVT